MAKRKTGILAICIKLTLLLVGVFYTLQALWGMCRTAMFLHESIVLPATVIDIRQSTFDSTTEALGHGNLSTAGDTAYRPIVAFTLPSGICFHKFEISTPDNEPYTIGQQVDIITYPYNPNEPEHATWQPDAVRIYKAKFLWGGAALLLLAALTLSGIAWLTLRRNTPRNATGAPAPQKKTTAPRPAPQPRTPQRPRTQVDEEPPFTLTAEEPAPKKKRAPRKKKTETSGDTPAPKKRKSPAKPRKKKAEAE